MIYDVVIIGAGVTGSAVARYLSRYDVKACVIEKEEDVCAGTSKANSAIAHAGFDAEYGSKMAYYNVKGSRMMEPLSKELDFPYSRCGSLVVCLAEEDLPKLQELYENGLKNGVEGLEIIGRERLLEMEPQISDNAVAALYAPTGAIVCPFGLTIALAENACVNGVEFLLLFAERFESGGLHIGQVVLHLFDIGHSAQYSQDPGQRRHIADRPGGKRCVGIR